MATTTLPVEANLRGRTVRCMGEPVDTTSDRFGAMHDSTADQHDTALLQRRLAEDGYLLLRDQLPRGWVLDVRRRILIHHAEALDATHDPVDGIVAEDAPPELVAQAFDWPRRVAANRDWAYRALCHCSPLMAVYERLLGGIVHLHRRKIIRMLPPGGRVGDVHQDLCYIDGGTRRVLTCWLPLGDVPVEVGGLMVLDGSHRLGRQARCKGMGHPHRVAAELPGTWRTTDYRAGDMVVFTSELIHTGLDNADLEGRRLRLSSDTRYQLATDPIDERWQSEWHPLDGL